MEQVYKNMLLVSLGFISMISFLHTYVQSYISICCLKNPNYIIHENHNNHPVLVIYSKRVGEFVAGNDEELSLEPCSGWGYDQLKPAKLTPKNVEEQKLLNPKRVGFVYLFLFLFYFLWVLTAQLSWLFFFESYIMHKLQ